jgi:hypothetical protein
LNIKVYLDLNPDRLGADVIEHREVQIIITADFNMTPNGVGSDVRERREA